MELHEFCPDIAAVVGVESALFYEHMLFLMRRNPKGFADRSWSELADRYCYMTIGQVRGAVERLIRRADRRRLPFLVRKPMGRGYRYWPSEAEVPPPSPNRHKFYDQQAKEVGIVGAIILNNFHYWINMRWADAADKAAEARKRVAGKSAIEVADKINIDAYVKSKAEAYYITTVERWQLEHLYVSLKTAKRTFAQLVDQDYLRHRPGGRHGTLWSFGAGYFKAGWNKTLSSKDLVETEGQISGVEGKINAIAAKLTQSGAKLTQSTSIASTPACSKQSATEGELSEAKLASQAQPENKVKEVLAQSPVGDVSGSVNPPSVDPEALRTSKQKSNQQPGTNLNVEQESKTSPVEDSKQQPSPVNKPARSHPGKDSKLMQESIISPVSSSKAKEEVKNSPVAEQATGEPISKDDQYEEHETILKTIRPGEPGTKSWDGMTPEEKRVRRDNMLKAGRSTHVPAAKPKAVRKSPDQVRAEMAAKPLGFSLADMTPAIASRLAKSKFKPVAMAEDADSDDDPVEDEGSNQPEGAAPAKAAVVEKLTKVEGRKMKGKWVFESEEEKQAWIAQKEAEFAADEREEKTSAPDVELIPVEKIAEVAAAAAKASASVVNGAVSNGMLQPEDAVLAEIYRKDTGEVLNPADFDEWCVMSDHWKAKQAGEGKQVAT